MKNSKWSPLLLCFMWLAACDSTNEKEQQTDLLPPLRQAPAFDADSAYAYVLAQVAFGPRVPGTSSHFACANFLVKHFEQLGAQVTQQNFRANRWDGEPMPATNIIASFNPSMRSKRILLAAHWDTRYIADQDKTGKSGPIDGANDGASGVAVLMEVARQLALHTDSLKVGVDIILFDVEDQGVPDGNPQESKPNTWCLGSQHWAANKHIPGYSAYYGILLDMVGAKDARFAKEGTSMRFAPQVVEKIWTIAHRIGYSAYFTSIKAPEITDDHLYVNTIAKIPMIDIIEYSHGGPVYFGPYWHTHRDTLDIIDATTLKAVGQVVLTALYNE